MLPFGPKPHTTYMGSHTDMHVKSLGFQVSTNGTSWIHFLILFILHWVYLNNYCIDWIHFRYYVVIDQNIAFLVANSCKATIRNKNIIGANVVEDII